MIGNFTTFANYLNDEKRKNFLNIALENWENKSVNYQPCGKRGYFNLNVRYTEYLPDIENMLSNIMTTFNVPNDGFLPARHFIGVNLPGAFVKPHTDAKQFVANSTHNIDDWIQIRYNTFLQKPAGGGVPIIGQTEVPLDKDTAIAFRADVSHATTPVEGNTIRVMFSIGSVVSPKYATFLNKI